MKKFKFSLQVLMNTKNTQKRNSEIELAVAINNHKIEIRNLFDLEQKLSDIESKITNLCNEGININILKDYNQYCDTMVKLIAEKKITVKRLEKIVLDKQNILKVIIREIKVLEKLKDKQYLEYCKELEKNEERIIDEFISYKSYSTGGSYAQR